MIKRWAFFLFVLSVIGITKVGGAEFRFGPGSPSVPNDRSELYLIGHIVEGDYERFREKRSEVRRGVFLPCNCARLVGMYRRR